MTWLDAQVGVLGSVLISPELAPRMAAETRAEDFSGDMRGVYDAITALLAAAEPVDAMTVRNRLGAATLDFDGPVQTFKPHEREAPRELETAARKRREAKKSGQEELPL